VPREGEGGLYSDSYVRRRRKRRSLFRIVHARGRRRRRVIGRGARVIEYKIFLEVKLPVAYQLFKFFLQVMSARMVSARMVSADHNQNWIE